jgi:uncharacterized protein DUF4124
VNIIERLLLVAAASLLPGAAGAQTFKCMDKAGKVTYTNVKCADLGLKDAGEVPDRINLNPAYQPPRRTEPPPSAPEPASGEPKAEAPAARTPAAGDAEQADKRRCFVVKTPTGNVTRCNDTPAE